MSLKTILVPLRGRADDQIALTGALTVARAFDAHIDGVFVTIDPRDSVPLLGEGMSGAMVDEIMRAAEADSRTHLAQARRFFDEMVRSGAVSLRDVPPAPGGASARWRELNGRAEDIIPKEGRLFDLLVFAHCTVDENPQGYTVLEAALLTSGRPLLIVPKTAPTRIGGTVAVAWNGNRESARAVGAAMPFLRGADRVHILTAETSATTGAAGTRLAAYLAWHDIDASVTLVQPGASAVGHALLERAGALGADLLVMGGYGHGRVREMILGGVTRDVLRHGGLPILMAH